MPSVMIQWHRNRNPVDVSKKESQVTVARVASSRLDSRLDEEGLWGQEVAAQGSWGGGLFSCCQSMYTCTMSCAPLKFNGLRPTRKCSELAPGGASFKNPGLRL